MRYGVLPVEEVIGLSTQARMEAYEQYAPGLATSAARSALADAGVVAGEVTDLIVVSCTGFSAPGVDVALVERLGLPPTVRRMIVGYMGCYGAIVGLRAAVGASLADPAGVCLVVCVELCTLHLRSEPSAENQVASALFGDGAAAAVIVGERVEAGQRSEGNGRSLGRVTTGHGRLIPRGRDWMTWRITDAGFAMTLSRKVPAAIGAMVTAIADESTAGVRPDCYIVHPGGPGVLDVVDDALGLDGGFGIEAAREVLRRYGNVSSGTVLFVLAEALRRGYRPPALLLAFGPGLAVETLVVQPDR
jgi:predicted naringenin-chalcone synthase